MHGRCSGEIIIDDMGPPVWWAAASVDRWWIDVRGTKQGFVKGSRGLPHKPRLL